MTDFDEFLDIMGQKKTIYEVFFSEGKIVSIYRVDDQKNRRWTLLADAASIPRGEKIRSMKRQIAHEERTGTAEINTHTLNAVGGRKRKRVMVTLGDDPDSPTITWDPTY